MVEQEKKLNKSSDNYAHIIRIPSLDDTYTFARNRYDSEILNDYILKTDFDKIINKASRIFGDSILKKRANDTFFISRKSNKLTIISLICIFFYVLFFYLTQIGKGGLPMFIFSAIFCSAGLLINLYQTYSSYFVRENRQYMTVEEIITEDLTKYLENVNNNLPLQNTNGSTLTFSYNSDDRSIECKIYKNRNGNESEQEDIRNIFSSQSSNTESNINSEENYQKKNKKNNSVSDRSNTESNNESISSSVLSNKKKQQI